MFTMTFYEHGSMCKTVVEAAKYSVQEGDSLTSVFVFPEIGASGTVFYLRNFVTNLEGPAESYRSCFVTSSEGRTIDRIEPKSNNLEEPPPCSGDLGSMRGEGI